MLLLTIQGDMEIFWTKFSDGFFVPILYLSSQVVLPNQTELPIPVASCALQILLVNPTVELFLKHLDPHLHFFVFDFSSYQIDNFSYLFDTLGNHDPVAIFFELELYNELIILRVEDMTVQDQIAVISNEVFFHSDYIFKCQQIDVGQGKLLFNFVVVKTFAFKNFIKFGARFNVVLALHLRLNGKGYFLDETWVRPRKLLGNQTVSFTELLDFRGV